MKDLPLFADFPLCKRGPIPRPIGVPAHWWKVYLVARSRKGPDLDFGSFLRRSRRRTYQIRMAWGILHERRPEPESASKLRGQWVICIHRKDLTPDLQRQWAQRIRIEEKIARTYRLSLRGLWRLEESHA